MGLNVESALKFLAANAVAPTRTGVEQWLASFAKGVQRSTLRERTDPAIPICKQQLDLCLAHHTTRQGMRLGLKMAWKMAARWSDVSQLQRKDLRLLSPTELLVESMVTKPMEENRPDHLIIVTDTRQNIKELITYVGRFGHEQFPWGMYSTKQVEAQLKTWPVRMEDMLACPETKHQTYTAHSIKAGAIQHLMAICVKARGVAVTLDQIQTMAKSAEQMAWPINSKPVEMADTLRIIADSQDTRLQTLWQQIASTTCRSGI